MKYELKKDEFGLLIKVPIKKPKTNVLSEASIQKQIAEVFTKAGWETIRYNSGTMQGDGRYIVFNTNLTTGMTSGHPDIICFKGLQAVRIEVKAANGRLSPNQKKYHENGLKRGNPILLMDSKDDAILLLKNIELFGFESAVYNFKK
jgi:hypothetical protein